MADPKKLPINKRYPGEHAVRCKIWFPSGSWVLYEGPLSGLAAGDIASAIVNSRRDKVDIETFQPAPKKGKCK
jgi:hypothetical protein